MYENLKKLRDEQGMNQADFGASVGVKKTTYSNYETGKTQPTSEFWITVAEKYQVSIDWLMGFSDDPHRVKFTAPSALEQKYRALDEHGKKVIDFVLEAETERIAEQSTMNVIDFGTIRHYLYSPAAGPDGQVSGEDYEDIPRTPDMPKNADYCLTVSGDSMQPVLQDGQMVFVSVDSPVMPLEVGVWFLWGSTYIKQFDPRPDGSIMLLSANPERESANIIIPAESVPDLLCYGKVLGLKKLPKPVYNQ